MALAAYRRAGALERSDEATRVAIEGLDGGEECPAARQVREDLANLLLNLVRSLVEEKSQDSEVLVVAGLAALDRYQRRYLTMYGDEHLDIAAARAELCREHADVTGCRPRADDEVQGPAPAPSSNASAPDPSGRRSRAAIGLIAGSATAAGVGFALSMVDLRLQGRYGDADAVERRDLQATGRRVETVQFVFYGISLTLAIVAIPVLVAARKRRHTAASTVSLTASGLGLRF